MLRPRIALMGSILVLAAGLANAQTEHGGKPPSMRLRLKTAAPTAVMPPVRADLLRAEDAARIAAEGSKAPVRFAEVLPVELGLESSGTWEELGRGDRVWRLRIHSPGAKSI